MSTATEPKASTIWPVTRRVCCPALAWTRRRGERQPQSPSPASARNMHNRWGPGHCGHVQPSGDPGTLRGSHPLSHCPSQPRSTPGTRRRGSYGCTSSTPSREAQGSGLSARPSGSPLDWWKPCKPIRDLPAPPGPAGTSTSLSQTWFRQGCHMCQDTGAGGQRGHRDWARPTPHGCVTSGKLPPLSELHVLIYKSGQLGTCQALGLSRELNAPSTQCRTDPGKCWLLAPAAPSAPPAGATSGLSHHALNRQLGICACLNAESPAGSGGNRGGRAQMASLLHLQQNFRDGVSCWDQVPGPPPCPSGPALGPCGWTGPHLPDSP